MILEIISFIKLQELTLLKNCHRKRIPKLCDEHQKSRQNSLNILLAKISNILITNQLYNDFNLIVNTGREFSKCSRE